MRTAIIGAGIAGIATAIRLASEHHEVTVFEANDYPGGKLSEFEQNGYRFDAGPSLFTMPTYVEELFQVAGEDMSPHFQYERLPLVCRYQWNDDLVLYGWADPLAFASEIEAKLSVPAQKVLNFLKKCQNKYETTGHIFLNKSLHKVSTWLNMPVVKAMLKIPQMDIFTTMNAVHERELGHPKLVQLFNRFATYNGSNPYQAPGILTIIPHFEHGIGAFYPKGGMYQITKSLWTLAQRKGVDFRFGQKVESILTQEGRVVGIKVNGEDKAYDQVVSNMDVYHTYKKLLPQAKHPEKTLNQPRSTSALIFYWGIRHSFPDLHLHNIFFSDDYRAEFDALAAGTINDDPTVYVNISSKCDASDAPSGCENWFVMVNVPPNDGTQDWDALIDRTRKNILKKLTERLGLPIETLIDGESILDPRTIESRTSSYQGALYGTSSNNQMAAFLRHPNFSNRLENLYFCGGSAHPGGGIPLCLLSAKIVHDLIKST